MIFALDNGVQLTDLDAGGFDILNVGSLLPVPSNLVGLSDPRLSDARAPIDGSVTNASVNAAAGIVQSKLNLNGLIPTAWMGTTSTTAAEGDLAEYLTNKGVAGGYASLDNTGKVPAGQLPADAGTGTATSVALTMPATFSVSGSPVTTSGTLAVTWANQADGSWFGNATGGSAAPTFSTSPIPASLVPGLPASQVTSGTFATARLPVAVGVGGSHAPGAVPDPGASGATTDYLGRDMLYHAKPNVVPAYQPDVPDPTLTPGYPAYEGLLYVIEDSEPGVSLFYSIDSNTSGFAPIPDIGYVIIPTGHTIYVYGAKAGYTNSNIVSATA